MATVPKPKRKKVKKEKKPSLAKMRKILDRLWYEVILLRDKGKCQKCGKIETLAGHHIFGKKAYPAGRWLTENGILLCYPCHIFYAHGKPYDFQNYVKDIKGRLDWWDDLHEAVMEKLNFRACDFGLIKSILEKEKSCLESSVK